MLAILTNTQETDVTYEHPKDKRGNNAPIQTGSVVWMTTNPQVATATGLSEDPVKATIKATGLSGACQIWPEADADMGDGVITIRGEKVDVQVTGGQAQSIGNPTLGEVREQA